MTVYAFYIFDRHSTSSPHHQPTPPPSRAAGRADICPPRNLAECVYSKHWLPQERPVSGSGAPATGTTAPPVPLPTAAPSRSASDDAKLIFGTVFSLRSMVRKLGGEDDAFICYRTGQYKLHYYETPTNLRLVLLTDIATLSMRNVLHQIYINLWVEYGESL
jgi:trafficking protein particle complex subunit 1